MFPTKENIINISKPYQWLRFLTFKKFSLYFIHKNASAYRNKPCPNGCVQYSLFKFAIKLKKVDFKHEFCHFNLVEINLFFCI